MILLSKCWAFFRVRKKYWLLPLILMVLMLSVLMLLSKRSASGLFIYPEF